MFQLAGSSAIWIILSRKERFLISNSPNVRCFCCTGRLARYLPRNASASAPRHFVNVPFPRGKLFESLFYRSIFQVKPSIHILHCPYHLKSDGHFTFHASFDRFQKRYPSVFASMNARRYEIAMKCYGWSVSQIYPIYVTPLNSCENRLGEYFLLILSSKFLPFFFNHRLIELSSKIFRRKKNTRQQKQTIYSRRSEYRVQNSSRESRRLVGSIHVTLVLSVKSARLSLPAKPGQTLVFDFRWSRSG